MAVVTTNKTRFNSVQDTICQMSAFVALALLAFAPIYLIKSGRRLFDKPLSLNEQEKAQIMKLFDAYKPKDRRAVKFSASFFFRRFTMICVLVFLPNYRNVQI